MGTPLYKDIERVHKGRLFAIWRQSPLPTSGYAAGCFGGFEHLARTLCRRERRGKHGALLKFADAMGRKREYIFIIETLSTYEERQ
jgi:hypothetical protein